MVCHDACRGAGGGEFDVRDLHVTIRAYSAPARAVYI